MNTKNVIKRTGVIFILGPIWITFMLLQMVIVVLTPAWGIFYYIFTGNDPIEEDIFIFFDISDKFTNWYMNKFGPK